ncbi:MAG: DUF4364 family protein, partial [Acutalibacteraceae bacterium]
YVLKTAGVPFSMQSIINSTTQSELANVFEVSNAANSLCADGLAHKDENGYFTLTEKGESTVDELKNLLNPYVREEAKRCTAKEVIMARRLRENSVNITPQDGGYIVEISMNEQDREILGLRLRVGTLQDAQTVKERFLDDPSSLYKSSVNLLLGYEI